MKLATALSERADIQRRLTQLQTRLNNNAKVQEGEEPAEDPKQLLKELDALLERLEWLMTRINLTNSRTLSDGVPVTATVDRYSQKEIKILSAVKVSTLQKQLDEVSKELRETDERIQALNWTTELCEIV